MPTTAPSAATIKASDYRWIENWAQIPDSPTARESGRTHGVCALADGSVMVFHQAYDGLLHYDPDGRLMRASGGERWLAAHGLTKHVEDGGEFLWLTNQATGTVAKVAPDGEIVQTMPRPEHPLYAELPYKPTWAAQNPDNGEIWIADGYGAHLVHRFTAAGEQLGTLDGSDGAGAFRCPHGIAFHPGPDGKAQLWITDRGNSRLQIFNGEGRFLRASDSCHSPCCFDFLHDLVLVPELWTGVKILAVDSLETVAEIGRSQLITVVDKPEGGKKPRTPEGWPNLLGTDRVQPGFFNSPHGAGFAANGDIYVVEWIIGGRITKLRRG